MKKSKLIVPAALAVMLLSTAASVTGTVAWFTANRAVETYAGNFSVDSIDGNLDFTATAGVGTQVDTTGTNKLVSIVTGAKMTDASYDPSTAKLYRHPISVAESTTLETNSGNLDPVPTFVEKTESEANWSRVVTVGQTSTTYYFAVSWTYVFTYAFGSDTNSLNLYLSTDSAKSNFQKISADKNANAAKETIKGFRMAFVNSAASNTVVWAQQQVTAKVNHIHAVNTVETGVAHDSGIKVLASDTAAGNTVLESAETGGTTATNYIGQFTTSSTSITVRCFAWFEGTDENVINAAEMDTVKANMRFFVRTNA